MRRAPIPLEDPPLLQACHEEPMNQLRRIPSRLVRLLGVLLALAHLGVAAAQVETPPSPIPPAVVLPPVTIEESRLLVDGQPFTVRGFNYIHPEGTPPGCPELHFGADSRCPWDPDAIEADMARLQGLGVNTIRIFLNYYVFGGARTADPQYDPAPALMQLDGLIASANRHGIYVLPVLLAKFPQEQLTAEGYAGAAELHVRPVLRHLAGRPGLLGLDLFNEPDIGSPIDIQCWDWDNGDAPLCLELAIQRTAFLTRLSADARELAPGHARTIGVAFAKSYFRPLAAPIRLATLVDFYSFHYYDNDPFDSGRYAQHWYYGRGLPFDLQRSIDELVALPDARPIVVTELGFPSGEGAVRDDAALRADLRTGMATALESGAAGVVLWPFQPTPELVIGELFRPAGE